MRLTLGFSPCPNDTFIFDALVNKKIDTENIEFDIMLEDVQTLNEWVMAGRIDISKISYGVLPLVLDKYALLTSGGALGRGVGPLLICRPGLESLNINDAIVAIPGENTTAHLLFSLVFPDAKKKVFMVFNEIEDAVLNKSVDAGVIIHENRFTYHEKGLNKLMDLGEYWEDRLQVPIPLGGIVARRSMDSHLVGKINKWIRKSVEYAFNHYGSNLPDFVKRYAQEMDTAVMRKHIDLYVNDFSVDLGAEGRKAVGELIRVFSNVYPAKRQSINSLPLLFV